MNQHVTSPRREPTQAAEGLPRWRWTLAEFERFIELGIFTEDDRVELIGGELIPMAAKGIRHESLKAEIQEWLQQRLPAGTRLLGELGWRPDDETYCEPDILVFPSAFKPVSKVPATEVLLLVEVAETSLKYDTATKAPLYARLGVREYWIANAATLEVRVHREPALEGYRTIGKVQPTEPLAPMLLPGLAMRLADLELGLD